MEPRPPRPSRPSQPYISTGATPGPGTPPFGQAGGQGGGQAGAPGGYGTGGTLGVGPFDASSAPAVGAPPIGYDPSYSPGQPLAPIDSRRGSRFAAPLLAVALLAVLVAGAAWGVTRIRGGDDEGDPTVVAQTTPAPTEVEGGGADDPDGEAEETSEPTEASAPDDEGGDTPAPTDAPAATGDDEEAALTDADREATRRAEDAEAEDTPTPRPSRERDDARSWLPLTSEVGEGWQETDEQRRDLASTAGAFPDAADAEAQLTEWGWVENVYRQFELPDADPGDTNVYIVSVHRFETAQGARDALPYFFDGAAFAGLEEARNLPNLGSSTRALEGVTSEGANQFVLYVREGDVIIRLSGSSLEGDPREDVLALAERILAE